MTDEKEKESRRKLPWFKMFAYEFLHGSISYQCNDAEQNIWTKLLALCRLCGGYIIADHDGNPFPHSFIAHEFHITKEFLDSTLEKFRKQGRITEDEDGIHILNWKKYQDEYGRQKPYREKKKQNEDPNKFVKGKYGHMVRR